MERRTMKIGSLFSGIGGLDLGIEKGLFKYGAETVWQVEMDKHCVNVLKKHWPDAQQIENDINDVDFTKLEPIDMLIGGFPCQTFSVAGSRKGMNKEDDRGILWYQFERAISETRPKWVVAENVRGLLTAKDDQGRKGGAFARVVSYLASRGYRVEWQIVSAGSVNAPHLRERVFIVAKKENVEYTGSKSDWYKDKQTNAVSKSRETRINDYTGRRGNKQGSNWKEIEQQMGSVSYGFCPGLAGNLGLPNYWDYFADRVSWRTPTTIDSKDDEYKHATKLLQGKDTRASGEKVQISLIDQVAMEELKKNPSLYKQYKNHIMLKRTRLPKQKDFVDYLRSQTTISKLVNKTNIKKSTIEHWFRYDNKGFSYPSIDDWNVIKQHLQVIKYNSEITYTENIEWRKTMWNTIISTQGHRGDSPSDWGRSTHIASVQIHYKEYEPWETVPRAVENYPLSKQKLKALGNAVVPACAEFVALCIARSIEKNTIVFDKGMLDDTRTDN